jgi:hypothetical protein
MQVAVNAMASFRNIKHCFKRSGFTPHLSCFRPIDTERSKRNYTFLCDDNETSQPSINSTHAPHALRLLGLSNCGSRGQWRQSGLKTGGSWVPVPPLYCVKDLKPHPPRPPNPLHDPPPPLQNLGGHDPQPPGLTPMHGGSLQLYACAPRILKKCINTGTGFAADN